MPTERTPDQANTGRHPEIEAAILAAVAEIGDFDLIPLAPLRRFLPIPPGADRAWTCTEALADLVAREHIYATKIGGATFLGRMTEAHRARLHAARIPFRRAA
ncbi:hypothetical protein P0W64_15040 [Tsukamurella sp. 8F]|uniref:hypothetical protein n=1 Tax=Tsukamurella sp. 8F TaxID=3031961 RepID=UPI0023B8CD13|nr:hypothetical protein [Tsukamurella sp. 8F]MDF0588093.1 hypothetical protein [Tsukamurella sp. 8F]